MTPAFVLAGIISLLLAAGSWWVIRHALRRIRERTRKRWSEMRIPRCLRCGYDLTGIELPRCPECGALRGFTQTASELGVDESELRR